MEERWNEVHRAAVAGISAHGTLGPLEAKTRLRIVGMVRYEESKRKGRETGEIGRLQIHLGALREEIHVGAHVVLCRSCGWNVRFRPLKCRSAGLPSSLARNDRPL